MTTTTEALSLDHLERIKGRDYKSDRAYGAYTYGYSLLRAHGTRDGQPAALDLLTYIHHFWGNLTEKRYQALEDTKPESLTLDPATLRREMADWVRAAKQHHSEMPRNWLRTAETKEVWGQQEEAEGQVRIAPQLNRQASPKVSLTPQKPCGRKATCQLCGELKPKAGMKGYGRDFKRICKDCRKILDL
ncbi:hypothetical protein IT415_02605 [bacterium]|nr:hypothetical protein [bacterium]